MTESDVAALRTALTDRLIQDGAIRNDEIAEAFRTVPRHRFLPDIDQAKAYVDEAIPIKWGADGRPLSSSSQPAIMAIMLAQLQIGPGQRVLEIGTGTGYNAALLTRLVGANGAVVTVDIDENLAAAARERLNAAGYSSVTVAAGDGAAGRPDGAPYDRIILTASARDLSPAWSSQLGDDGRLLLPLSLRGTQQSVCFKQAGDHLVSISVVPCGFMPLMGELAGDDPVRPFGEMQGVFLRLEDDRELDLTALRAALGQPGQTLPTGVTVSRSYYFTGLGLWLALHDPGVGELAAIAPAVGRNLIPATVTHIAGMEATTVLVGETSLAAVVRPPGTEQDTDFEALVRGYGPDGDQLAERLAEHIRGWESAGCPATPRLRIRAYPASAADHGEAAFTITMPHTRFLLDW